ncbi:uncharacterized protein LOC120702144 [Panicum virgatum]|uniref:uncharacterized protein LOC120702144 n=1 Tax=Panicum virgatum TaxID=38727 RepID=UPI0019D56101|nr:uncharacterized protein LOC120702144 [Panicum virgatum]
MAAGERLDRAWLPAAGGPVLRGSRAQAEGLAGGLVERGSWLVADLVPPSTAVDLQAPLDDMTGLPLIMCPTCKDVWVFTGTTTKSQYNIGKRFFKCPRQGYGNGRCSSYWFEEEYVVYLEDHGYLLPASSTIAAASTTEVPKLVGKIDSLEQNLNEVKEMVGKNREGLGSCICLVCGCVNVTIFVVLAIGLVVAVLK